VFGKIGVGSFLCDQHHVREDKRHHVVIGTFLADTRKHALHDHPLSKPTYKKSSSMHVSHSITSSL